MLIKVIKVTKDGKVGYIRSASIFNSGGFDPVVDSPLQAKNYALPQNASDLASDLRGLHLKADENWIMGGTPVDTAHVVEIEVAMQEVSCVEGRQPHPPRA
jgi:hypothetical protein